jgi:hypothetical protein
LEKTETLKATKINKGTQIAVPPGRRKRGRPKLTWAEEIRGLMGENGLMEVDCNDRNNWRKKIL